MKIKDKVLIVEDEQSISSFISMILTANGYDTIIVNTGEEALTMISSHCPDLVILDLGLPDMDGLDILRSLRSWSSLPGPRSQKTIIASGISACCFGSSSPFPAATCSSRALIALCSIQRSSKSSRIGLK